MNKNLWDNLHWLHGQSSLFPFLSDEWRGRNGHCKLEPLLCFILLMTWLKELLAINCLKKLWRKILLVVIMALVSIFLCVSAIRQTSSLCQPSCHHFSLSNCTARKEQPPSSRIHPMVHLPLEGHWKLGTVVVTVYLEHLWDISQMSGFWVVFISHYCGAEGFWE